MAANMAQEVTPDIDFSALLPPSIAYDPSIMAAAGGASSQFTINRDLIPRELIYARIDELEEDVLDHVAWGMHVEGWEFATTLEKKRYLIKNFYDFHRYKGTLYGHRLHWRALLGLEILRADPPSKSYIGVSMTEEERQAFEKLHPEVRIYPFRHFGTKRSFFCGDCLGDPADDYGVYPAITEALLRIGDKVTLYDPIPNSETELNRFQYDREYVAKKATDTIEVRKPGTAFGCAFCGGYVDGATTDTGADERFYTLTLEREYATEIERRTPLSIRPTLTPFRTSYETTRVSGIAKGLFLYNRWPDSYPDRGGSFLGQHYPVNSDADKRIYKRLKLYDPSRMTFAGSRKLTYLGAFRIGRQPPHTARIAVDMQSKRIPGAQFITGYLRNRHLCKSDAETRIEQMRYVGNMARRLSDKVLIQIHNRFPVTASSGLLTGSKNCGEYQLETI